MRKRQREKNEKRSMRYLVGIKDLWEVEAEYGLPIVFKTSKPWENRRRSRLQALVENECLEAIRSSEVWINGILSNSSKDATITCGVEPYFNRRVRKLCTQAVPRGVIWKKVQNRTGQKVVAGPVVYAPRGIIKDVVV